VTHGGKRPGAGRPATGRKVRTYSVCLTADELARILAHAAGPKPSLSASVRRLLALAEGKP
jgi:hypothetical protein